MSVCVFSRSLQLHCFFPSFVSFLLSFISLLTCPPPSLLRSLRTKLTIHLQQSLILSPFLFFFLSSVFSSLPFFLYWPFFPLLVIYTISFRHDCRHFRATTHPPLVLCRRVVLLQYRNFVFSPRSLPFLFFLSFSPLPTLTTL